MVVFRMIHQTTLHNARVSKWAACSSSKSGNPPFLGHITTPSDSFTSKAIRFPSNVWISSRGFTSRDEEPKIAPSGTVSALVEEISCLTLLEVADLTEVLRKKLNIEEMPMMTVMMPGMGFGMNGAAKGRSPAKEQQKAVEKTEKTAFALKLEKFDVASKIKIIKEVRTFTDLGLKEAKDLVEKAPAVFKKGVSREEAEKVIAKMKEVGATVAME